MEVLWFLASGLATAAPPTATDVSYEIALAPQPLVELSARALVDIEIKLDSVLGKPLETVRLDAASADEAWNTVAELERTQKGDDFVVLLFDLDDDGWVDLVDTASGVRASAIEGPRLVIERPIFLDTNADGRLDRLALYPDVPAPVVRTAAR